MKKLFAFCITVFTVLSGCNKPSESNSPKRDQRKTYLPTTEFKTNHFVIRTSASSVDTDGVAKAVEALHAAYSTEISSKNLSGPFHMILYKDRVEFKRNNSGPSWAEALYRQPYSYAYPAEGRNRHHWMLHEATHQLLNEGSHYRLKRWINEGTASYFGSSQIKNGHLLIGKPDPGSYPIWFLSSVTKLSNGDITLLSEEPISLRDLLEESDAANSMSVNHRYIAYWSLVHYLIHGESGKHYPAFKVLLERGGSPDAFRELIGPFHEVEKAWKKHLWQLKIQVSGP